MIPPPAQEFRSLLTAAAATARPDLPLRLLVQRRAPLMSQGEHLGHLDALLRLSCHGDGHGSGVLVFDWPTAARGHSICRLLEEFSKRHGDGALRIEYGENDTARNGTPPGASVHLKVHFDAATIPDEMLELLGLAHRMKLLQPAREEIGRYPPAVAAPAPAQNGVHTPAQNGVHAPAPKTPAPKPRAEPVPAPRAPHPEQDKIDQIVNHAQFDSALHPHVDPNEEVTNSNGEAFRLIMRRGGGSLRRQWLRIGKELARS